MKLTALLTLFSAICTATASTIGTRAFKGHTPIFPIPGLEDRAFKGHNPIYPIPGLQIRASPNETVPATGSLEEIRARALEINPNWDEEYYGPAQKAVDERFMMHGSDDDSDDDSDTDAESDADAESGTHLSKRLAKDFDAEGIYCTREKKVDWINARREAIRLVLLDGAPRLGAGPGKCSRVGCTAGSAIVWCNDNREVLKLKSWDEVADGAWAVIGKCRWSEKGEGFYVSGQARHKNNWNVIVRSEKC
ncbi:uncharacterized protein DSM5745_06174 [Aspergillus mulundensis]|uniref:Uncharacterized protein n=1 Tax=Aspergillus mulundensis TaxID=1810919 RepID=A0A3D8RZ57_9EURO|nr:hypothetical protein DSM5745_06174 [Aspergillus mulundensis]RDW79322.1 hypothetical protein DSM5745_06174 [Aspergillus mulundensis]